MKRHLKCLSSLAIAAAGIPLTALGHPGHTHDAGTLAAVNHAAIGLDQLLIVFAVAAVAAYAIGRLRR